MIVELIEAGAKARRDENTQPNRKEIDDE